ncbi:MAG TPA: ribonuclease J [bacterium]|nr:ribonuclease J [bacterium]
MAEQIMAVPLGGLREVGKNCLLLIYHKKALMVDCGMGFPGNDYLMDDDFFIPDFDALATLGVTLEGVVITHGHEDHIGAIPYLLRDHDVPVYLTEFPAGLLKERMGKVARYQNLVVLPAKRKAPIEVGPFTVRMLPVPHSIPEAKGLLIEAGPFKLLHTGDFKCDGSGHSPFYKKVPEDIDMMFVDSTNIEREGVSKQEPELIPNLRRIIAGAKGRIIVTAFSSNIERIKNILAVAQETGRTVGFMGRSVRTYTRIAQQLGYLELPGSIVTDESQFSTIPDKKLLMIVTGSQAEPRSIMKRLSLDMLKAVPLKYGDTILFSSKIIPGNETAIGRMMDSLVERGVNLFYEATANIHASGHGRRDDLLLAAREVNPSLIVPVHGHLRFIDHHCRVLEKEGFSSRLISDGDVLVYTKKDSELRQRIDLQKRIVSNYSTELVDIETIRERKRLARSGGMTVVLSVNLIAGKLVTPPRFLSLGIASASAMKAIERALRDLIYDYFADKKNAAREPEEIEDDIRVIVRRYLTELTDKKPVVTVVVTE